MWNMEYKICTGNWYLSTHWKKGNGTQRVSLYMFYSSVPKEQREKRGDNEKINKYITNWE